MKSMSFISKINLEKENYLSYRKKIERRNKNEIQTR